MNVYELLIDCIVHVQADERVGTGFFVSPGLILTCAHVVSGSTQIILTRKGNQFSASIEYISSESYPDLALLRTEFTDHSCVMLDDEFSPGDELYIYGFPGRDRYNKIESTSLLGKCEGKAYADKENLHELITFRSTNVVPGLSGSPVMNLRTQRVCGLIKLTRDRTTDMGGRAVPSRIILAQIPELVRLQANYHSKNDLWIRISRLSNEIPNSTVTSSTIDIDYWLHKAKQLCELPHLSSSIRIDRPEMMSQLTLFAKQGSGIIVGDAGVGKTYSMRQLGIQLINTGIPCVFLSVADLNSWNDLNILPQTHNIATEHGLRDYIKQLTHAFNGIHPIILLDAFDAATSPTKRSFVLRIADIAIQSNANILITTRLYDAENSVQLRQLFPVEGSHPIPTTYQADSIRRRHFLIPRLSSEELEGVLLEIPTLLALYQRCGPNLQALLGVPFNLMLIDILRQESPDALKMGCITSEVELLDLYWKYRVWETEHRHHARILIQKICSQLVDERTSFVSIDDYIDTPEHLETIEYLCSVQILAYQPGSQQRLSFVHKLLFDYIVSILIIPEDVEHFVEFFSADRTRTVYLIPSARYYFTRLWLHDRALFWRIVLYPTSSDTERHLKLFVSFLPPRLIVETVQTVEELTPLIEAVDRKEIHAYLGVRALLKMAVYLHQDEIFSCDEGKVIRTMKAVGDEFRSSLWLDLIDDLLPFASPEIGADMATIAKFILDTAKDHHHQRVSRFSHQLFEWSFSQLTGDQSNWHQWFLDRHIVTLITMTYETNPDLARKFLVDATDGMINKTISMDVVHRIISNFDDFLHIDPECIEIIYLKIFSHEETSNDPTHMGGIIVPMRSTRRQDFSSLIYLLVNYFPKFLDGFPLIATRTMAKCLNGYLLRRRGHRLSDQDPGTLLIRGRNATFVAVHYLGHRSGNQEMDPEHMVDLVFQLLLNLSQTTQYYGLFVQILDSILENIEASYLWGALIDTATQNPEIFSKFLFELLIAQPIINSYEAYHKLRSYISVSAEYLTVRQLRTIEEELLDTEKHLLSEKERRDREILIASIPFDLLQTGKAKQIYAQYHESEALPPNRPPVSFGGVTSRALTDFDWAEEVNVNLDDERNATIRSLWMPIQELINQWRNQDPDKDVWLAEFEHAARLFAQLNANSLEADTEVINKAWTELAEYTEILCRFGNEISIDILKFCREVMLRCSQHIEPIYNPEWDDKFGYPPSWSPAPRIEAAQGILWLVHYYPDPELEAAVLRLSRDKVPSIRFIIAHRLILLYQRSGELFWTVAKEFADLESNDAIWAGLLVSIGKVRDQHDAEHIVRMKMESSYIGSIDMVFEHLIPLTLWYAVDQQQEWALAIISHYISDPLLFPEHLSHVANGLLSWMDPKVLTNDPKQVAQRAIGKLDEVLHVTFSGIESILESVEKPMSEDQTENLRTLSLLVESLVSGIWSSSGLHSRVQDDNAISPEELKAFYYAIKPILSHVATAASSRANVVLSPFTSHSFIEILNGVFEIDASDVFHMAAQMVEASQKSGYQFDSLAVREVVKMVCKSLADHKYLFISESNLDDLVIILDVFYQAGWPEAFYLVGRLDQIFE